MSVRLAVLVLVALPLAAAPTSAAECQVVSTGLTGDVEYATLCVLNERETGNDGTQRTTTESLVHGWHVVEVDPAFHILYVEADHGTYTYDDGEVRHEREFTNVRSGMFDGVRGVTGGGYHVGIQQRDQTLPEDEGSGCASTLGRSTCVNAGAWWTQQVVSVDGTGTSVGAAVYYRQVGEGDDCAEDVEVYASALVTFVPVTPGPGSCREQMPWLADHVDFSPVLP